MARMGPTPPRDMGTTPPPHHMARPPSNTWAGWITFAATVLILLGVVHVFQGFIAMLDDGYFAVRGEQLFALSYDAYGALLMLWGAILLLVGAGLLGARGWARWLALIVVGVDVLIQVGFFPAQPLLSLTLIALDTVVLYALTVRWEEATGGLYQG
jgi:hypothetical protein